MQVLLLHDMESGNMPIAAYRENRKPINLSIYNHNCIFFLF
jgi:hypothetical protein